MSIAPHPAHESSGSPHDSWSAEVRRQALTAVEYAIRKRGTAEHAARYFVRTAIGHGVTVDEIAEATGLLADEVRDLADPAAA